MTTARPLPPDRRAPGSHVNGDGLAKRSFGSERAVTIEVARLEGETGRRFDWYRCNQRPEHWHLSTWRQKASPS